MPLRRIVTALGVLALTLSACGGAKEGEPGGSHSLSINGTWVNSLTVKCTALESGQMITLTGDLPDSGTQHLMVLTIDGWLHEVHVGTGESFGNWDRTKTEGVPVVTVKDNIWRITGTISVDGTPVAFDASANCQQPDRGSPLLIADTTYVPHPSMRPQDNPLDHLLASAEPIFKINGQDVSNVTVSACGAKGARYEAALQGEFDGATVILSVRMDAPQSVNEIFLFVHREGAGVEGISWAIWGESPGPSRGVDEDTYAVNGIIMDITNEDGPTVEAAIPCTITG